MALVRSGMMTGLSRRLRRHRPMVGLFAGAFSLHVGIALLAAWMPEMGDQVMFKVWSNLAVAEGIHRAYVAEAFHFDWLPFILYVSKAVGLVYFGSGLGDVFGPYSRVLTLLVKVSAILFHLGTALGVYFLACRLGQNEAVSRRACGFFLFNPAIILATDVFGYQDALHTLFVVLALYCLCSGRGGWAPVWGTLGMLTKPQAVIFFFPAAVFLFLRRGTPAILKGLLVSTLTAGIALLPFIVYGTLGSVFRMYLDVPRVHQWLTGCAHNLWWLFWPAPPFYGDRDSLILGVNGLVLGLGMLVLFTAGSLWQLVRRPSCSCLVHLCAFLAFAFFMVTTEMHENYLYAAMPFLAICAVSSRFTNRIFVALTVTWALDMGLTFWLLETDAPVMLGPVRVSTINALVNTGVLVVWSYRVFRGDPEIAAPRAGSEL